MSEKDEFHKGKHFAQLFTFLHVCHFSLLGERNLTFASSITTPYLRGGFYMKT